jgi:hypothetical protein
MSLEPGRLCKVSSRARKSFDTLHLKAALDSGSRALCTLYHVALPAGVDLEDSSEQRRVNTQSASLAGPQRGVSD